MDQLDAPTGHTDLRTTDPFVRLIGVDIIVIMENREKTEDKCDFVQMVLNQLIQMINACGFVQALWYQYIIKSILLTLNLST